MYTKCEVLRMLLIDEISAASLQLLGTMESHVRRARSGMQWNSDAKGEPRDWGGVNIAVFGDWNQLPPVAAKSIFRNPFLKGYSDSEQNILGMFWGIGAGSHIPSSPKQLFELTLQVRSNDVWRNHVLQCNRRGKEPWEVYCFSHELPTRNCGSWLPHTNAPSCGNARCKKLREKWQALWGRKRMSWIELLKKEPECNMCHSE